MLEIKKKHVGEKGISIHTKLSPNVAAAIAKLAKENKARKAAVVNELLKQALNL